MIENKVGINNYKTFTNKKLYLNKYKRCDALLIDFNLKYGTY